MRPFRDGCSGCCYHWLLYLGAGLGDGGERRLKNKPGCQGPWVWGLPGASKLRSTPLWQNDRQPRSFSAGNQEGLASRTATVERRGKNVWNPELRPPKEGIPIKELLCGFSLLCCLEFISLGMDSRSSDPYWAYRPRGRALCWPHSIFLWNGSSPTFKR